MSKTRRYTLAEMKSKHTGYFFSRDTMKFFKGDKYGTRYDRETGTNYLIVTHPGGSRAWWIFHPSTGKFTPVPTSDVPRKLKEAARK